MGCTAVARKRTGITRRSARSRSHSTIKYRSRLEARVAQKSSLREYVDKYETAVIKFIQPAKKRTYKPDFPLGNNNFIEVKGYFDKDTRDKHLWIKEQNPDINVYFIFSNKRNRIARSKKTYEDWCNQHGFECISENERIPKHWFGDTSED